MRNLIRLFFLLNYLGLTLGHGAERIIIDDSSGLNSYFKKSQKQNNKLSASFFSELLSGIEKDNPQAKRCLVDKVLQSSLSYEQLKEINLRALTGATRLDQALTHELAAYMVIAHTQSSYLAENLYYVIYQRAMENEVAAMRYIGLAYQNGYTVQMNEAHGVQWYKKAALQGDAEAQFNLALMYGSNRENAKKALKWYRRAAKQGHSEAQFNLAVIHSNGWGVRKDNVKAAKWYRRAAKQGHLDAKFNLAWMYEKGLGVRKDRALAVEYYRTVALQGHAGAQFNLAEMYEKGWSVRKDSASAVKWYTRAALQGDVKAQRTLGLMYEKGKGVKKDDMMSAYWYTQADEQARRNLAEQARRQEEQERKDAVERSRREAEQQREQARREAEENARKDAVERSRREAEQQREQARREAEKNAQRKADELLRKLNEEHERRQRELDEQFRKVQEEYERRRREIDERLRKLQEEQERRQREFDKQYRRQEPQGQTYFETAEQKDVKHQDKVTEAKRREFIQESKMKIDQAFKEFNLPRSATYDQVKGAYKEEIMRAHPDKGGSEERIKEVLAQYEILQAHFRKGVYEGL